MVPKSKQMVEVVMHLAFHESKNKQITTNKENESNTKEIYLFIFSIMHAC